MALLQVTCSNKGCSHVYYRIYVECNRNGVDTSCPQCGQDGEVHVVTREDGESPFNPCSHT